MPQYDYKIGTSLLGMTNVESLTVPLPAPKSTFKHYTDSIPLGDGTVRGVGFPSATWRFGFLTAVQRDQLRLFCAAKSNTVYIRTKTIEPGGSPSAPDVYDDYQAVMVWPDDEERDTGRRLDFVIEFRHLVEA